jgi:hypothetical protein
LGALGVRAIPPAQGRKRPGDLTGATLVGLVLDNWSHLPDLQFRALMRMAHTALDTRSPEGKPPCQYFGTYRLIAQTWRPGWPGDGEPDAAKKRRSILNEVRKALRALETAGAVKPIGPPPVPGHPQEYLLTL